MSRLGFKSVVYHGDVYLGDMETVPVNGNFQFPNNEIRIHHISQGSERCHPLSVLQTLSSASFRCKLDSSSNLEQSHLINLHASCFYELKTAVVLIGNEEFHLVAMPSKQKRFPCFWCYSVPIGVYDSSLWMLNTRCLLIVFDLDETLVVANTIKSIDDMILGLMDRMEHETDPIRESGMASEMRRYVDDRAILKQYADTNCVVDGGKMYKAKEEEVPYLSDGRLRVVRPVVRLPHKNIVLTRIHPENRDTSVLVRLRPAWEQLKNYLTARGRKRFDVYVCTMAERDYALEMWRLLDPEAHLISAEQLMDRVVCVKSGDKKSLLNVFRNGNGDPKMAMVIDDRLKVWEDSDQPRVHVVPAFTPYYDPQAETGNDVPVLCVARNVACNIRGCFFKEFDENLLRKIPEIFYEDEIGSLPCSPDVSNFLTSEDNNVVPNGNPSIPIAVGSNGPEVAQRLVEENVQNFVSHPMASNIESKPESSNLPVASATAAAPANTKIVLSSEKPGSLDDLIRRNGWSEEELPHGCKVEFRPAAGTSDDLPGSVEVFFAGDKVGVGMGKSVKDAQQQAAENALVCLAEISSEMNFGNEVTTNADATPTVGESSFVGNEVTTNADATPSVGESSFVGTHPTPSPAPVNPAEKPEKFTGLNFKRWKQKMQLYLTTLNLTRFLTEEAPNLEEGEDEMQAANTIIAWKHSDSLCRKCVMDGLEDSMHNEYGAMESAKELWEALDRKYKTEDSGARKRKKSNRSAVRSFLNFKMMDSKPVVSQLQQLQGILNAIHAEGMVLCESFQVAAIIEKLPPAWRTFQDDLKQKEKEMNVEELAVRLRTEEENRNSMNNGFNPGVEKANVVEQGQNSKGNTRLDASSSGAMLGPKGGVSKRKMARKCYNCEGKGHLASNCRKLKKNLEANMSNPVSQDVSGMHQAAFVSELSCESNVGDHFYKGVLGMCPPAVLSELNQVRSNSGVFLGPKGGVSKKKIPGRCFNCDVMGHRASDCKKPKRNREAAVVSNLSLVEYGQF